MYTEKASQRSVKRVIKFLSIVIVAAFVVAACGSPTPTQPPAGEPPTQEPATEAPPVGPTDTQEPSTGNLPVTNCDTLLPAEACEPDWANRIQYVDLTTLPKTDCTQTLLTGAACDARVYPANNDQQIVITIEGADINVINEYINNTKMYFEIQQAGTTPPVDSKLPSLAEILLKTALDLTGKPEKELIELRDGMLTEVEPDGGTVTFAEVLAKITGGDAIPGQVFEAATAQAEAEYSALGADPSLILSEMERMMNEAGAPILVDPTAVPADDSGYQTLLMNDRASLAVTFEWTTAPKEQQDKLWTVWYAVDPTLPSTRELARRYGGPTSVGRYASVYYKEKCNVYTASVRLFATGGRMTAYFWRLLPSYLTLPNTTADALTNPYPPGVTHTTYSSLAKYDTRVQGGYNGGTYYIYGGWVQGSGC